MTFRFSERHNRFHAGKRLFSFFVSAKILRKIHLLIWSAIIIVPSPIESLKVFAGEVKPKLIDGDVMLLECRLQDVGGADHVQGLTEFGDLRCKRLSQLHTCEMSGVNVGKTESEAERNPRTNQSAKKSEYRLFHDDPTIDGIIGGVVGLILGSILVTLLCKYVWFRV